eukprot:scaffold2696_cov390-Prasinococcus_capsulatus_cf.AAC.1
MGLFSNRRSLGRYAPQLTPFHDTCGLVEQQIYARGATGPNESSVSRLPCANMVSFGPERMGTTLGADEAGVLGRRALCAQ